MRRTFNKMMQAFALCSFLDGINHFLAYLVIFRGYQSPVKLVNFRPNFVDILFFRKLLEQHSLKKRGLRKG